MGGEAIEVAKESGVVEEGAFLGLLVFGEELGGGLAAFSEKPANGLFDTVVLRAVLQKAFHGRAEMREGGEIRFEESGDGLVGEGDPGADGRFEHLRRDADFAGGEGGHLFDFEVAGDIDEKMGACCQGLLVEKVKEL